MSASSKRRKTDELIMRSVVTTAILDANGPSVA